MKFPITLLGWVALFSAHNSYGNTDQACLQADVFIANATVYTVDEVQWTA